LIVQATTEDKHNYIKASFYKELEYVCDKFPKYYKKILLGDFNAKVGREDSFKPRDGDEIRLKISNYNGVRVVNIATSKQCTFKRTMFSHCNIYTYSWNSAAMKTQNQTVHFLIKAFKYT
jgi:exonuclease III